MVCEAMLQNIIKGMAAIGSNTCRRMAPAAAENAKPENGGDAGDTSTCLLLTRLPSRRTMPGVLRSVPAILRSAAAILWSATSLLRLRLGQPNPAVDEKPSGPLRNAV